ncbi:MAG TPA: ATP-dependent helicase C-terminal domain-containing protein [Vicinamibacterales bacterium]|nr:ATP-dependent helicase C-terminal domain-containing protein [Vicinamibacterales bacterium]
MLPALPVDSALPQIVEALNRHRAAVLVASPGAGKTTRVPPALVDRGRVLLLQPRRVAARAMTRRIAVERGWTVGREIGWHIRFERRFSDETRLLVVTEGILTAYLQQDPLLSDVSTVIVDEFHERSVHADLGLALVKQAWLARDDLHILVMSATLDPGPVAAFLGDCPVIDVPGTLHPLTIEYAPGESIATALEVVLSRADGNILCFQPGAREIAAAINDSQGLAASHDVDLVALHGSMDGSAQDTALSPSSRRRIIVATNIAETSLTVSGVTAVIDTGLHKVARYDEERGIDSLTTERITLDSADQRAGRAARLGPGIARRLWDGRDRLRPHREPEIHRVDLSAPLLSILAWGADPHTFEWFDRPSDERLTAAMSLLSRLGAVNQGQLTEIGRTLQRIPLHPRLARVLIEARGSFEGCAACAWLSEPSLIERRPATSSDLLPILDRWNHMAPHLRQAAQNLQHIIKPWLGERFRDHIGEVEFRRALLSGYPDRVARRRPQKAQTEAAVTLATGHGAVIARESGVHDAEWLIALDVTSGRTSATTQALVRMASRIEPEWLTPTRSELRCDLDRETGAVRAHEVDWYDEVVLREHPVAVPPAEKAGILAAAWASRTADEESARLIRRLRFAGASIDVDALIATAAASARRLDEVVLKEDMLPWDARQRLSAAAPDRLQVPSGREMTIDYAEDGSVSVSVKLQELFGLAETPRIGPAKMPITFYLLAPNGRPVQTTQDLKSFWERTYPEVRKELRGRYPRHPWPEDPWTAPATHRTKRR